MLVIYVWRSIVVLDFLWSFCVSKNGPAGWEVGRYLFGRLWTRMFALGLEYRGFNSWPNPSNDLQSSSLLSVKVSPLGVVGVILNSNYFLMLISCSLLEVVTHTYCLNLYYYAFPTGSVYGFGWKQRRRQTPRNRGTARNVINLHIVM